MKQSVIRVGSWNIRRGYHKKELEILNFIKDKKIDILTILECDICDLPNIPGFQAIFPKHRNSNNARLLLLAKKELSVKVRDDLMTDEVPTVWVELELKSEKNVLICSIYREWLSSQAQWVALQKICDQLQTAASKNLRLVIMGDLNLCQLKWKSDNYKHKKLASELQDCVAVCGLEIHQTGITYRADHVSADGTWAESSLDHLYSTPGLISNVTSVTNGLSDHAVIIGTVNCSIRKDIPEPEHIEKRCYKHFNEDQFKVILAGKEWERLAMCSDVNSQVELYDQFVCEALDQCAPIKRVKLRQNFKPGLTTDTLKTIKARNSAKRAFTKDKSLEKSNQYKILRNRALKMVRQDYQSHMQKKFGNLSSVTSVTNLWKATKHILNATRTEEIKLKTERGVVSDQLEVANQLNVSFLNKVSMIKNSIPQVPQELNENTSVTSVTYELRPVSESVIKRAILNLKTTSSTGLDGLNTKLLKCAADILTTPLTFIVNTSILTGVFPKNWKHSQVVPLHKKGSKLEATNYRPVSLLPVSSKVLEVVVKEQIYKFCEHHTLIPDSQHGFRIGRSTTTALVSLHDHLQLSLAEGSFVGLVQYDLSAAFDTLSCDTLLNKLKVMGFSRSPKQKQFKNSERKLKLSQRMC